MIATRADIYEQVILAERPTCPYCGREMSIWECYESALSCDSSWDTPYLFVCFNDECRVFVEGWESMKRHYGRRCSYRCVCPHGSANTEVMLVLTDSAGKSEIVDEAVVSRDKARGTSEDPAVCRLVLCFQNRDVRALLASLFDEEVYYKVRLKAAELIGELGIVETLDPLLNCKFHDERISDQVHTAIKRIHDVSGTRQCPYCAEIISSEVTKCTECGRDISPGPA